MKGQRQKIPPGQKRRVLYQYLQKLIIRRDVQYSEDSSPLRNGGWAKGDSRLKEQPDGMAMAHLPRDEVGEDRKQKRWGSLKEALVFYSVETVIGRARSSTRREKRERA